MTDHVIVVHGLWMRAPALFALDSRLRAAGFAVERFGYASITTGPQEAARHLAERIASLKVSSLHLIGHSLGGLVALQALRLTEAAAPGRVVCLGSPLNGSRAAQRMGRWSVGRAMLGKSLGLLQSGVPPWDGSRPVGVIAGTTPFGIGMFADGLVRPHDGTVSLSETQLPGIADHICMTATHTGLVFSAPVAQQAIAFLKHGKFERPLL